MRRTKLNFPEAILTLVLKAKIFRNLRQYKKKSQSYFVGDLDRSNTKNDLSDRIPSFHMRVLLPPPPLSYAACIKAEHLARTTIYLAIISSRTSEQ